MIPFEICFLSVLFSTPCDSSVPDLVTAARVETQDRTPSRQSGRGAPGRGTPEPVTILLVAGTILGYGALRMRGRKGAADQQKA